MIRNAEADAITHLRVLKLASARRVQFLSDDAGFEIFGFSGGNYVEGCEVRRSSGSLCHVVVQLQQHHFSSVLATIMKPKRFWISLTSMNILLIFMCRQQTVRPQSFLRRPIQSTSLLNPTKFVCCMDSGFYMGGSRSVGAATSPLQ